MKRLFLSLALGAAAFGLLGLSATEANARPFRYMSGYYSPYYYSGSNYYYGSTPSYSRGYTLAPNYYGYSTYSTPGYTYIGNYNTPYYSTYSASPYYYGSYQYYPGTSYYYSTPGYTWYP